MPALIVAAGFVVAAAVPAAGRSNGAAPPFDTVPDGAWLGSLIYDAEASFPGSTAAEATGSGTFDFVVAGGIVTEGTMGFSISGLGFSADAIASLDFVGNGGVEGTSAEPVLRADSVHISGTAASQGIEVPISLDFGAGELTPIPLEIYTVTCEQVTGDFVQNVADAVAAAGGTGSYFGRWVALRGDDPSSAGVLDAYETLVADAEHIVNAGKSGQPIDPIALLDALDRAEQFAASIPINTACRNIEPEHEQIFSLAISVLIADLIEAVLAAPAGVNLTVLQDVVAAGIRAGVLSANAPPDSTAEALSIQLQAEFETRLATALGPPVDADAVQQIMLTALSMGWTSTADKAKGAL